MKEDPKEWLFEPTPKQARFLDSDAPELLYSGAFGAGKTRALCEKGLLLSYAFPGNIGLIGRKYGSDLSFTTMKSFYEEVCPPSFILKPKNWRQYVRHPDHILVKSKDPARPSEIYFNGLDRPNRIASMNLGWAAVDEAIEITEDQWTMLAGRLRLRRVPFHQLFTATNPGAPAHWLYRRFYDDNLEGCEVIETNALENPYLPQDYLDRINRLTGVFHERFVLGKWVGHEGLVYPDFNPRVHIVDGFDIPFEWPKFGSVDFGTANPFVFQWWAEDPGNGDVYMYREIYMSNRTVRQHAETIRAVTPPREVLQYIVADHDAGDRLELVHQGINTIPAVKDVRRGIELMNQRLSVRNHDGSERRPTIFYFRNALVEEDVALKDRRKPTDTTMEFGSYKWSKGTNDSVRDEPMKVDDHGVDSSRYFIEVHDGGREVDTFGGPRRQATSRYEARRGDVGEISTF